jgi:mannosyltransferase OCH1-like enzyme
MVTKIPKKIHLVWLGSQLPEKFFKLKKIIYDLNPDYEIFEWNDNNLPFELSNQKLFNESKNYAAKSDILRYELLYNFGGVYMDYDFLQVKKFDDLLNFDIVYGSDQRPNEFWNSIILSSPKNLFFKKVVENLKDVRPFGEKDINRIMDECGGTYLQKILKSEDWSTLEIKQLVGEYFYPLKYEKFITYKNLTENNLSEIRKSITDKTYAIHIHTREWQ